MEIKKILIIDDDHLISMFMNRKLNKLGYECKACLDPREAIQIIQEFKPNLIFLDVMMPVINGIELAHIIKNTESISNIPIIIISAKSNKQDINSAYNIGVHKYIFKPITLSEVINEIEELKKV